MLLWLPAHLLYSEHMGQGESVCGKRGQVFLPAEEGKVKMKRCPGVTGIFFPETLTCTWCLICWLWFCVHWRFHQNHWNLKT